MKHEMKARYPASSAVVLKMFSDLAFQTDKLDALGYAGKYKVLGHSKDAKSFNVRIERKVPIQLPGMGKNVPESTVVNDETWNLAGKTGTVTVDVKGMPLAVSCVTAMADEGKECVISYQWEVKSKIPLIGGTIEKMVIADMTKKANEETVAAIALLKGYR